MPVLDYKGVVDAMFLAGWSPGDMYGADDKTSIAFYDTALAVCFAESGFNTNPPPNPKSSATGLWQILSKTHAKMVQEEVDRWSVEFNKTVDLTNPVVNTSCARRLFQERSWQPWEAYNTGAYKKYLGKGAKAHAYAKTLASDPKRLEALKEELAYGRELAATIGAALSPLDDASNALDWSGKLLSGIAAMASTVGIFLLGAILLIVGLWIAAGSPTPTPAKAIAKVIS